MRKIALFAVLLGAISGLGCIDHSDQGVAPAVLERGEVRLPLVTTTPDGRTFRLENAKFAFSGPLNQTVSTSSSSNTFLEVRMPIGNYIVELLPGWQLIEMLPGGVERAQAARVRGESSLTLNVNAEGTNEARFQLELVESGVMGTGKLGFEVQVGTCLPTTCTKMGNECGTLADGCGKSLDCGTCASGSACNSEGKCISTCVPKTCAELNANCASVSDGCGGTVNCGTCPEGQACNDVNQCISVCIPQTCDSFGAGTCGTITERCGTQLTCAQCAADEVCNTDHKCEKSCKPKTCQDLGATCGKPADGCGGTLDCGACATGQTCNDSFQCISSCVPRTCASAGATCGTISDNCDKVLNCGTCPIGEGCTSSNTCQTLCVPRTCASVGAVCGSIQDNCGATLNCGVCPSGQGCGTANTCEPLCVPKSCKDQGAACGSVPDTCGGTLTCGTCATGMTCTASNQCQSPVTAVLKPNSTWATGYCMDIIITNAGTASTTKWAVVVDPQGGTMTSSWNTNRSTVTTGQQFTPLAWNAVIPPKGSTAIGFCATDPASGHRAPTLVSATGSY